MMPGLAAHLADQNRAQTQRLRNRLKEVGLEGLYEEVMPGFTLINLTDRLYSSGQSHPSININDSCVLFEDRAYESDGLLQDDGADQASKARKPPKGEAWGLAHHLQKVLIFLVCLRMKKIIAEQDVFNALYIILKVYREERPNEVGLHYLQALLDYLHKTCLWTDKGTLPSFLVEPQKLVVDKLIKVYHNPEKSSSSTTEKQRKGLAKGGDGKGGRKGPQQQQRGDNRRQVRSRTPPRNRQPQQAPTPPAGQSPLSKASPVLKAAFTLAKKESGKDKKCPFAQIGSCTFGGKCNFKHFCVICNNKSHVAKDCPDLNSDDTKKKLGVN
jgi:hypothetical protein